jgi:hypothetical protein
MYAETGPSTPLRLAIDSTEPVTADFTITESVEADALLTIRGSIFLMFSRFRVDCVRVTKTDQELTVVHRFSFEEMNADWSLHSRARSLAVARTTSPLPAGATIRFCIVATETPAAAPGVTAEWTLERIARLHDPDGTHISYPFRVRFEGGALVSLEARQKPTGERIVRGFDAFGYPVAGDLSRTALWEDLFDPPRVKVRTREGLEAMANAPPQSLDGTPVFFGDYHWHSEFSDGQQALAQILSNARDRLGLDFAGPSDHMSGSGKFGGRPYADQAAVCRGFDEPGRFSVLPVVEAGHRHGHVHVIAESFDVMERILAAFPDVFAPAASSSAHRFPWQALRSVCPPQRSIISPCHPNLDSGDVVNPKDGRVYWYSIEWPANADRELTRTAEICRGGASQETEEPEAGWPSAGGGLGASIRTALLRGYRIGFAGSSDSHEGWPARGGITAVQTSALDTSSVFKALYDRRCYATSGIRIVADATLNDLPIGSELRLDPDTPRRIRVRIQGTAPIVQVQIISAGAVVADMEIPGTQLDFEDEWTDLRPGRHVENVYYYVRARQDDGHCVWLSPFWIDLP